MRLLLCFLVLAGVIYAGHAFFSGEEQASSKDAAAPVTVATSPSSEPSQQLAAEDLTPSPAGSRHAIAVEHNPLPSPSETSPAPSEATSSPVAGASRVAPLGPSSDQPAFIKVMSPASIREGPSTSAAIVGVAQPGAEAQIVSRSTDWVEIIDPGSRKTGWIHESFLAPQDEPASRPVPPEEVDAALAATPESESAEDEGPSIKLKSRKQASRHRHRRHTIVLGPFILRFR